jgi:hypothetical protein
MVDNTAIPTFIDAAGRLAIGAVMLMQGEGRNDYTQYGQDQEQISHAFLFSAGQIQIVKF